MESYKKRKIAKKRRILYLGLSFGVTMGIAYVFYKDLRFGIFLLPICYEYYGHLKKKYLRKEDVRCLVQFKDFVLALATSLSAGYSLDNAIAEGERELSNLYGKGGLIQKELQSLRREMELNQDFSKAMERFGKRVKMKEIRNFSNTLSLVKKTGGSLKAVMVECAEGIDRKVTIMRTIDTMITGKELEWKLMMVLPLGLFLYMRVSSYDTFGILYETVLGRIVMTACLCLYMLAYVLGEKIINLCGYEEG